MIGLREFLHWRRVPSEPTPICSCGDEPETVDHVILRCTKYGSRRGALRQRLIQEGQPLHTRRDLAEASTKPKTAKAIVRWLLETGRLPQFDLAEQIAGCQGEMGGREEDRD